MKPHKLVRIILILLIAIFFHTITFASYIQTECIITNSKKTFYLIEIVENILHTDETDSRVELIKCEDDIKDEISKNGIILDNLEQLFLLKFKINPHFSLKTSFHKDINDPPPDFI